MNLMDGILGTNLPEQGQEDSQSRKVDFKMVTFSLGGKDYGIDIMQVKEIFKAETFTPVPNTARFVRGVFNLRGEIISIIDLRRMFNIPDDDETESGAEEDLIFLNIDDSIIGIVVDSINDVVGTDSATIQPPHPLFGDINIKYISGVVQYQERLYILLDLETIFGKEGTALDTPPPAIQPQAAPSKVSVPAAAENIPEVSFGFITETLATFLWFYVGEINELWVKDRFEEWKKIRGSGSGQLQLKSGEDAEEFLQGFSSRSTDQLWPADLGEAFAAILPELDSGNASIWNVGCGSGPEAYSLACILKKRYPAKRLKVWAHDKDLLKISSAPNLAASQETIPEWLRHYTVEGRNGYTFNQEIQETILFEYHDVANENTMPPVIGIVARDILSFLQTEQRTKVLEDFYEKLLPGGILVVGENEKLSADLWSEQDQNGLRWYTKR